MKFLATYINLIAKDRQYRTLWADDVSEATKIAERWRPKGYMLESVIQNA